MKNIFPENQKRWSRVPSANLLVSQEAETGGEILLSLVEVHPRDDFKPDEFSINRTHFDTN